MLRSVDYCTVSFFIPCWCFWSDDKSTRSSPVSSVWTQIKQLAGQMRTFTQEALLLSVAVLSIQRQLGLGLGLEAVAAKGVWREIENKTTSSSSTLHLYSNYIMCQDVVFAVCGVQSMRCICVCVVFVQELFMWACEGSRFFISHSQTAAWSS